MDRHGLGILTFLWWSLVTLTLASVLLLLIGCSNQSRTDYYDAVAKVQLAQAEEAKARYEALKVMASSEDEGTSVAAVMAIALQKPTYVAPQYIQPEALLWTQALAAPLTSVTALWLNSENNKAINKQNTLVSLQRIRSENQTNRALYELLSKPVEYPEYPDPVVITQPDNQIVDVTSMGFDSTTGVAIEGFQTIESIVQEAFRNFHVDYEPPQPVNIPEF